MTVYDDPNREAVGEDPIWTGAGDNVAGTLTLAATGLDVTATLAGGISDYDYDLDWGDSATSTVTTDGNGDGTDTHTYAADGTYTVTASRQVDGASTSKPITVTAGGAAGYDLGTVDDVQKYVEAHPDETEAVLQAETAGKNRTTLIAWLEERLG